MLKMPVLWAFPADSALRNSRLPAGWAYLIHILSCRAPERLIQINEGPDLCFVFAVSGGHLKPIKIDSDCRVDKRLTASLPVIKGFVFLLNPKSHVLLPWHCPGSRLTTRGTCISRSENNGSGQSLSGTSQLRQTLSIMLHNFYAHLQVILSPRDIDATKPYSIPAAIAQTSHASI
jgi:hypothetical protein